VTRVAPKVEKKTTHFALSLAPTAASETSNMNTPAVEVLLNRTLLKQGFFSKNISS